MDRPMMLSILGTFGIMSDVNYPRDGKYRDEMNLMILKRLRLPESQFKGSSTVETEVQPPGTRSRRTRAL